mgnify:CR=1 FL=1
MSQHLNQRWPERQASLLRHLSRQTDLSVAELLRRMVDHCCTPPVLNTLLPALSGSVTLPQER